MKRHEEHSGFRVGRVYTNTLGHDLIVLAIVEYRPEKIDICYRYTSGERVGVRPIEATKGWKESLR